MSGVSEAARVHLLRRACALVQHQDRMLGRGYTREGSITLKDEAMIQMVLSRLSDETRAQILRAVENIMARGTDEERAIHTTAACMRLWPEVIRQVWDKR